MSNYINVDGKPRVALINGPLVLSDDENNFKAAINIKGLVKKRVMLNQVYVANLDQNQRKSPRKEQVIDGLIYKSESRRAGLSCAPKVKLWTDFTSLSLLQDVKRVLATVKGSAIDQPVIQEVPFTDWSRTSYCDPIPAELALPSDIRFREDLICLKRGEKGKGKVWKHNLQKQQKRDVQTKQK